MKMNKVQMRFLVLCVCAAGFIMSATVEENKAKLLATKACEGCDLQGADLHFNFTFDLKGAKLASANLSGANLSEANLSNANFENANLSNADLRRTLFDKTFLWSANLTGANLSDADFHEVFFFSRNHPGSTAVGNLSKTDLTRANFRDTDLRGVNFEGAKCDSETKFPAEYHCVNNLVEVKSR